MNAAQAVVIFSGSVRKSRRHQRRDGLAALGDVYSAVAALKLGQDVHEGWLVTGDDGHDSHDGLPAPRFQFAALANDLVQAPRDRVLVHRQFKHLWDALPDRVQQFYDHVAYVPGSPAAINRIGVLRGKTGRHSAATGLSPGVSHTAARAPSRGARAGLTIAQDAATPALATKLHALETRGSALLGDAREARHVVLAAQRWRGWEP